MTDPRTLDATQSPLDTEHQTAPPAALVVGVLAALLGGAVWALIVMLTKYEVGWVAWGVGGVVGFAMARRTDARGRPIAAWGAALAALGLVTGKLLIVLVAQKPLMVEEVQADRQLMAQAVTYDLDINQAFPDSVQEWLESLAPDDTLPDALAQQMYLAGFAGADHSSRADRARMAEQYVEGFLAGIPWLERIGWQLGVWDVLWFGLAISTAWRMLQPRLVPVEVVDEPASDPDEPSPPA